MYVYLRDANLCGGCRACEVVCALTHQNVLNPRKAAIRVIRMEPGIDVPVVCHQCQKPLCAEACPVEAIVRNERSGAVIVDEERCFGCGDCVEACPFGAITWHHDLKIPVICDLCDGQPKCVKYCFTEALKLSSQESVSQQKRREWVKKLVKKTIQKQGLTILY